jgi:hypothetical protein
MISTSKRKPIKGLLTQIGPKEPTSIPKALSRAKVGHWKTTISE